MIEAIVAGVITGYVCGLALGFVICYYWKKGK